MSDDPLDDPPRCEHCGFESDRILSHREVIEDLERQLRILRSQLSKLKGETRKNREKSPHAQDAQEVYEYWREKVAPKAKEFTGPRFDAVVARLAAGHSVEDLKQAVDGMAARPYVTDSGRRPTGEQDQRAVELELICRGDQNVMRFQGYALAEDGAEAGRARAEKMVDLTPWEPLTLPMMERLRELKGWSVDAIASLCPGYIDSRVVFPVHDRDGALCGQVMYAPNPAKRNGPKSLAEGERNLFPAPESCPAGGTVWLVEGEPDAVAMRTIGLPGIAVPGVATWKIGWAQRFERFERVVVCFDCDDAGRENAAKRQQDLGKVTRATVIELDKDRDDGFDVGDLLKEVGPYVAKIRLEDLLKSRHSTMLPFAPKARPFDAVVNALEARDHRVKRHGRDKVSARCPNHDDNHPSLSVSEALDGKVLLHCHTGCSAAAILEALGLTWRDAFPERGTG